MMVVVRWAVSLVGRWGRLIRHGGVVMLQKTARRRVVVVDLCRRTQLVWA